MEKDYVLPKNYTDEDFDKFIKLKKEQAKSKSQPAKVESSKSAEKPEENSGLINALEAYGTGSRSVFDSMFLGAADPAISSVNAVVGNLISSGFDAEDAVDFVKKSVDFERLKKEYKEDVELRKKLKKKHEAAHLVGSLAGAFSGLGPAGAVTRTAAKAVDFIPKLKATKEAGGILGGLAKTAGGAGEGALLVPAIEGTTRLARETTGFGDEDEAKMDLSTQATLGAAGGGAVGALRALGPRRVAIAAPLALGGYLMYPESETKQPEVVAPEESLSKKIEDEQKWQQVKKLIK